MCVIVFYHAMESLHIQQSDRKRQINYNCMELEVLVEKVNKFSVKQRHKNNR